MLNISIAGLNIDMQVQPDSNADISNFSTFQRKNNEPPNITINFNATQELLTSGIKIYSEEGLSWWKSGNNTEVVITKEEGTPPRAILHANETWTDIHMRINATNTSQGVLKTLGEVAFRTSILFYSGLVVHAAAIKWNNKGIILSAPSNTGKSTQASLWEKNMGATILNGDRPAMRMRGTVPMVYGTPWSGSSPDFQNSSASLSAIIMLEQGVQNRLRELPPSEAVSRLAARCFLPYWDRYLMDMALSNLEKIVQQVPVALLQCRPDQEAVELVRGWIV